MGALRELARRGVAKYGDQAPIGGIAWMRVKTQEAKARLLERMAHRGEQAPRHDKGETREQHAERVARWVLQHGAGVPDGHTREWKGESLRFWRDTTAVAGEVMEGAWKYEKRQAATAGRGAEVELPKQGGGNQPAEDPGPEVAQGTGQVI